MNVHCTYCRHSFILSKDFMAQAVLEAAEKKHKAQAVECPKCRKSVKVAVKQMRRFVPPSQPESE